MRNSKPFTWIASAIFALMAAAHLYRVIKPFPVSFGSVEVPQWASIAGFVIAAGLSWMLCREARGRSTS